MLNHAASSAPDSIAGSKLGMDYKVVTLEGDYRRGAEALIRIAKMAFNYPVQLSLAAFAVNVAGLFQLFIPRLIGDAVDHATGLLAGAAALSADTGINTKMARLRGHCLKGQ